MRVSTGMTFESGTLGITRNQGELYKLQNQLSTGRRVNSPSDDPVASSQILLSTQSQAVNQQYLDNIATASDRLGLLEGNLSGVTDVLQSIRQSSVQLGNATLSQKERAFIADELQGQFDQLLGLANEQNGEGQFLYSGFQGATKPFAGSSNTTAPFLTGNESVNYLGDAGQRLLQIGASRQIPVTASGDDVFSLIHNGNGTFTAQSGGNSISGQTNAGTGLIGEGSVLDSSKWDAAVIQPQDFEIQFRVDNSTATPVTYYNLVDRASGSSMFTNAELSEGPPYTGDWKPFTPGQAIYFKGLDPAFGTSDGGTDLGAQVVITGAPANGDTFKIKASQNQSIFDTVKNLIAVASMPVTNSPSGNTEFMNNLAVQMASVDRGLENVLRVRSSVGARLSETEALQSVASDLDVQYSSRLSNLQDLDYAKAISDLTRRQMQLEAAQQSFVKVTGLSLFDMLR